MAGVRTIRRLGGALSAAALLGVAFVPARAQQAGAAPQAPQAQAPAPAGRGGGGLNDACGGRSGNPTEACPNDVERDDRDARPAARQAAGNAAEAAEGPDLVADPVGRIPALVDSARGQDDRGDGQEDRRVDVDDVLGRQPTSPPRT